MPVWLFSKAQPPQGTPDCSLYWRVIVESGLDSTISKVLLPPVLQNLMLSYSMMNESLSGLVQCQTEPPALQSRSLNRGATVLLGSIVSGIGLGGKPGSPALVKVM